VNSATTATASAATAPTPSLEAGRAFKKLTLPEYGYCPRCKRDVRLPELPGRGRVALCPYCGGPLRVFSSLRRRLQRAPPAAPLLEPRGSYATHYYCANCRKWVPRGGELRDALGRPVCPACLLVLRARRRKPKHKRGWEP
jgi:DNA-directed RNA polymerase subunit RPC12/RpoP